MGGVAGGGMCDLDAVVGGEADVVGVGGPGEVGGGADVVGFLSC